jgi:hypothetical protein
MFILRDITQPLQAQFSHTELGKERSSLFIYTLLSIIIPFTSSITSNCYRCLTTLFGIDLNQKRFYTFMASSTLPWQRVWQTIWGLIPSPETDGRLLLAVDDTINPKSGTNIFACDTVFDHAAKTNQSQYPWAQNIVAVGLLKRIKGRWACLFMDFRFYIAHKTLTANSKNARIKDQAVPFQSKLEQACHMLIGISQHFPNTPVLAVMDSWFGNYSVWQPVRKCLGLRFHILSRLRSNNVLYNQLVEPKENKRGRPAKYGKRIGSTAEIAKQFVSLAKNYTVELYGKTRQVSAYDQVVVLKTLKCSVRVVWVYRKTQWIALFTTDLTLSVNQIIEFYGARWKIESGFKELKQDIGSQSAQCRKAAAVINHLNFCLMASTMTWIYADKLKADPERRHKVKGRTSFAFSDVRHIIAEAALNEDFVRLCPKPSNSPINSIVAVLLRMVA